MLRATPQSETDPGPRARVRTATFKLLAALLALALLATGGRLLIYGWLDPRDGGIHRFQDLAWGVIEGVILLAAIAPQLRRPARRLAAVQQALVGLAALVLTMLVTLKVDAPTVLAGVLLSVLIALHPARAQVLRVRGQSDPVRLTLALAGAVPLLIYALHQAALMRATPSANPLGQAAGFAGACAASLAVASVAVLAALRGGRSLPAWSATTGALVLGIGSIAFPHHPSSLGAAGGAAAIIGAIAFAAATLRTRRSTANVTQLAENRAGATTVWRRLGRRTITER